VIPYRKFSDALKSSVGEPIPPKPPKATKVAPTSEVDQRTLGGLGALGAEHAEIKNFEPAAVPWTDAQEERAAIIEHDAGAPRDWPELVARLDPAVPPGDVPPRRWVQFIDDCGRFLDAGWAERAAALGWHLLDLFGCDRERPLARIDHAGLLWLLDGRKLIALTATTATIEARTGSRQTYYRASVAPGRVVLPW
jgi:hypothetical protein